MPEFFIPGNVPSLKNSRVSCAKGSFYSKTVRHYLQSLGIKSFSARSGVETYKTRPNLFAHAVGPNLVDIKWPAIFGFHFIRDSKRKFDFHNAVQIIADLLVAHGFIPDDCMDYFIPVPIVGPGGRWYSYDKDNPGVVVRVTQTD